MSLSLPGSPGSIATEDENSSDDDDDDVAASAEMAATVSSLRRPLHPQEK